MSRRDDCPEACVDCGGDYWPGRFDVAPFFCQDCYDARAKWADEQEARLLARRMLKAELPSSHISEVIPQKDVA